MKKLCFLSYAFFVCLNVFSVELWNGFTDDMTERQVIARIQTLNITITPNHTKDNLNLFSGDQEDRNDSFIIPDRILECNSPNPAFSKSNGNIFFYFFNNKLYAVEIEWNGDIANEVIEKSKENYGGHSEEIEDFSPEEEIFFMTFPESTNRWLYWDSPDREIYLKLPSELKVMESNHGGVFIASRDTILYVISKNHNEEYKAELERRNRATQQEAEAARQRQIDGIRF